MFIQKGPTYFIRDFVEILNYEGNYQNEKIKILLLLWNKFYFYN